MLARSLPLIDLRPDCSDFPRFHLSYSASIAILVSRVKKGEISRRELDAGHKARSAGLERGVWIGKGQTKDNRRRRGGWRRLEGLDELTIEGKSAVR